MNIEDKTRRKKKLIHVNKRDAVCAVVGGAIVGLIVSSVIEKVTRSSYDAEREAIIAELADATARAYNRGHAIGFGEGCVFMSESLKE